MIDLTVPLAAAVIGGGLALMWGLYLRFFVVVPPNEALVIFGGRRTSATHGRASGATERGVRIVVGGGAFIAPWVRQYGILSLSVMDLTTVAEGVATKDGHDGLRFDVRVSAQVKIASDAEALGRAAEALLGRTEEQIKGLVRSVIEGHVPVILTRVHAQEIGQEWAALNDELHVLVAADLWPYGLSVDFLAIKKVASEHGHVSPLTDAEGPSVQLPEPDDLSSSLYRSLGIRPEAAELPGPRSAARLGRLSPSSRGMIPEEAGA